MCLFLTRFGTFMIFGAKTHPAPVVTAQLAIKAILARMLLDVLRLFFRNINLSFYSGYFNKLHQRISLSSERLRTLKILEPISKIMLEFRARRGSVKKRSIHVVCEHFEPFHNAAMDTKIVFEIGSR